MPRTPEGNGGSLSEAKQREVLQLLRYYRSFHPWAASRTCVSSSGMAPPKAVLAGMVLAGQEYMEGQREALAESYGKLDLALKVLKGRASAPG